MSLQVYQYRSSIGVFFLAFSEEEGECELLLNNELLRKYSSVRAALANVSTLIAGDYESDITESLGIPTKLSG